MKIIRLHPVSLLRHGLIIGLLFGLTTIFTGNRLEAYTPGRWSPLDIYVLKGSPGGPRSMQVLVEGKLREEIHFKYDAGGRLEQERYVGGDGKERGIRNYIYHSGRLVGEELFNIAKKLIERKEFVYKGEGLSAFRVYDGAGKVIFNQRLVSRNSKIVSGEEGLEKEQDHFNISYTSKDQPLKMIYHDGSGQEFARIEFTYDGKGRLKNRTREQGANKSKCEYVYNSAGNVSSFTYFTQKNGVWNIERTLELKY